MRSEKFCRAGEADGAQRAGLEIRIREPDGARIRIRISRDLAQEPVAATAMGENQRRSQFGLRQIGKGKAD
jgi:hypothetical protein